MAISAGWVWGLLRRPQLYPELLRRVRRRLEGRGRWPSVTKEATGWCESRALPTLKALHALGVEVDGPPRLEDRYPAEFEYARAAVAACPEAMGGGGNVDLLFHLCEHARAMRVVETGVAYGWSSLALLLALERTRGRLVSTDMPYLTMRGDPFVGCAVPPRLRARWTLFRQADRDALPKALGAFEALDLCHYDSDKTYEGRAWAYPLLWDHLRPGGFLVSDDVEDNFAFKDFCEAQAVQPVVVRMEVEAEGRTQYMGVVQKP